MKKKINEIHYLSLVSVLTFEPSKSFSKVEAHRCHLLLVSKSSNRAVKVDQQNVLSVLQGGLKMTVFPGMTETSKSLVFFQLQREQNGLFSAMFQTTCSAIWNDLWVFLSLKRE